MTWYRMLVDGTPERVTLDSEAKVIPSVWAYARVSTDEQVLSLAEQESRLTEWGEDYAAKISGRWRSCRCEQESAVSVGYTKRPEFQQLLQETRRGDHLAVWRVDRIDRDFFRQIEAVGYLNRIGLHLHSLELGGAEMDIGHPTGRALAAVFAISSDMFVSQLKDATKRALDRKQKDHLPTGCWPRFGHKYVLIDGQIRQVWDAETCATIREIWYRHRVKGERVLEIAKDLIARGIESECNQVRTFNGEKTPRLVKKTCPWASEYGAKRRWSRNRRVRTDRVQQAVAFVDELRRNGGFAAWCEQTGGVANDELMIASL